MTTAAERIAHPDKLFIDGQWVAPSSASRIEVINPATEQVIASVAEAREPDMDKAVAAARRAFDEGPWPRMSHAERGAVVMKLAELLEQRTAEIAGLWTEQMGGLASFAPLMTGGGTFQLKYFAGLASNWPFEDTSV
jgi:acyl-CoA reductase-like NAD-dependent aldehyde dehydrogenase